MRIWPLALVLVAGRAVADPAPTSPPPDADATAPAPAATGLDLLDQRPGAERGFLFESAATLPAGKVEVSARAMSLPLGVADVAVGITSSTQLSLELGAMPDDMTMFATSIEQVVAHTDRFRFAVLGTLRQINEPVVYEAGVGAGGIMPEIAPFDAGNHDNLGALGAVATGCFDAACTAELTVGAQAMWNLAGGDPIGFGWGDLSVGSESLRAVGELLVVGNGGLAMLGLRGGWRRLGLEAAVAFAPGDSGGASPVPYVGLTFRP